VLERLSSYLPEEHRSREALQVGMSISPTCCPSIGPAGRLFDSMHRLPCARSIPHGILVVQHTHVTGHARLVSRDWGATLPIQLAVWHPSDHFL